MLEDGTLGVTGVRVLGRYDVEGIEQALFDRCMPVVFSEPPVDVTYDRLLEGAHEENVYASLQVKR